MRRTALYSDTAEVTSARTASPARETGSAGNTVGWFSLSVIDFRREKRGEKFCSVPVCPSPAFAGNKGEASRAGGAAEARKNAPVTRCARSPRPSLCSGFVTDRTTLSQISTFCASERYAATAPRVSDATTSARANPRL